MRWIFLLILVCGVSAQDLADQIRSAQAAGKYEEAARLYRRLISGGSDSPEIRSNCGVMLHLAGKNREAMEQFRVALRLRPGLAGANLFAGLTEIDLDQPQSAVSYLKRAQEADPSGAAPRLGLGKAYVALRQYALANENYARAAALDGQLAEAWYGLGVTDRSLADELLNRAARKSEQGGADRGRVKELLDKALQALTRAMELEPNAARTHLVMAESLSDAGKLAEAVPEYQTSLKLDPELEGAELGLASAYWKQREFDEALPHLKRVLAKWPKDPEANGMMADILQHSGQDGEALRHAEIALGGNPNLIETRLVLARVYVAREQPKLAIAELNKVIGADPDGSYHFLLYRAYKAAGDEQGAQTALKQFEQLRNGHGAR